jgi:predicted ATPase/DNA-binding CsgD family transcriptional regulator
MGTVAMTMQPGSRPGHEEERAAPSGVRPLRSRTEAPVAAVTRLPARRPAPGPAGSPVPVLGARTDNLPAPFASFVGRERQLEELARLLAANRLVTLTGAPGVGKTRLGVQLANQLRTGYAGGVWMVELADLDEPALMASAVARSLGVSEIERPPIDALVEDLRDRELLLVLDNCEHLLDACAALAAALLTGCPGVRVLATSRQALGLTGEIGWQVPPLSVPGPPVLTHEPVRDAPSPSAQQTAADPLRALLASEAGRLFVERARAARASFDLTEENAAAVGEICRRVDGIPLAIELAAARIGHLAPRQIADRLDDRFRLLARGRSSPSLRHDTLRSLVDWSHDLLSAPEQVVFRRMAVFAGGWTLEAAEAVCGGGARGEASPLAPRPSSLDALAGLVDKSLVVVDEQPGALRYAFHETIRHYAHERLDESGEGTEVRRLHAEYYLELAEDAAPRLFGTELQPLLDVLDQEHDNLRLALRWACEAGESDVGPRLAGALWRFWQVRGYLREGRAWLERLLASAMPAERTSARARALNAIGFLAFLQGDYATARPLLAESVEIWRALDDRRGLVESLTNYGVLLRCIGDGGQARRALEEAIAASRALGDRAWEGRALNKLARLTYYEGDLDRARALHEGGIATVRQAGNAWDVAIALGDLGDVLHAQGDDAAARRHYAESLQLWLELGDERGVAQGLEGFAILAAADAQPERAVHLISAARALRERITEPSSPSRRAALEQLLDAARAKLGAAYGAVWASGQAATPAEAVAEAVSDHDARPADHDALPVDHDALPVDHGTSAIAADSARPSVPDPASGPTSPTASTLTERERDVAELVARGYTNRQISDALVVSKRTTEWHIKNLLRKTGLTGRAQLIVWTAEHVADSGPRG